MATEDANIKRLLEAERGAQDIVSSARKHRNDRLKQAKLEAEREISDYRNEREAAYQKSMNEGTTNIDESRGRLDSDTKKNVSFIKSTLPAKKPEVVDALLSHVLNVAM